MDSTVDETVRLLTTLSPTIIARRTDSHWGTTLQLSYPAGADYEFHVHVCDDGEPQVTAELISTPELAFWSQGFEIYDCSTRAEQLQSFRSLLEVVLMHPTRITYRRRLLVCSFSCEAYRGGTWQRVGYSAAYLRF